ncbi:MAG: TonB-dependent receptor [Gammaproteobacteria bacterium]|nr:TonB-dependent receptor [Gammaproteobacteria bacterium]
MRAAGVVLFLVSAESTGPLAHAQRAGENAVTAASDAFGTVVGTQTIGLYSPTSARGFSPTQAENIRIEGLYFDQQTTSSDPYLFSGTNMRVGIAAQSYAFPSPSGIADLSLRTPGDTAGASLVLVRGPLSEWSAEIDARYPLRPQSLSVGVNVAAAQDFDYNYALASTRRAISLLARWRPTSRAEIVPFFGYIYNTEDQETPFVFADGTHPLPQFNEQHLPTQSWTTWTWTQITAGVIASFAREGPWSVRAGLFRSETRTEQNFNDLMLAVMPDGTAHHVMDVTPPFAPTSYSGDLRVVRSASHGTRQGELTIAARARHVDRDFGGDSVTDLGSTSVYRGVRVPEPALAFSEKSRDEVRQSGLGVNYTERWSQRGALSLGVLLTDYKRKLTAPGASPTTQHDTVALPTVSFNAAVAKNAVVYASYTRGLEDSPIAPATAVNRGEPPPATPTWQVDGGARLVFAPYLQLLGGVFKIHKSYFSLDTADQYTRIGDITSQGIESSATFTGGGGLTIVAGAVWLRPQVQRQVAELGGNGSVPIGPVPRTININLDYAPPGWRGWGLSLQWTSLSARVETTDDQYRLPPLNTLNLGLRYLSRLGGRACSARLDVGNITNAAGLTFSSAYSYLVVPQLPRNYTLTLAADL